MSAIPVGRAGVLTRPRLRARAESKARARAAAQISKFMTIAAFTYVAATLSGQVLLEKARRESLTSLARAQEARQAESLLRRQVDGLTSLAALASWSKANGFVAPDEAATSSEGGKHAPARR